MVCKYVSLTTCRLLFRGIVLRVDMEVSVSQSLCGRNPFNGVVDEDATE
jgi:hypothetical protein